MNIRIVYGANIRDYFQIIIRLYSFLFTLSELCKLFVCCISTGKCIYFMLYWMLFSNLFDIFAPDFNLNVITI